VVVSKHKVCLKGPRFQDTEGIKEEGDSVSCIYACMRTVESSGNFIATFRVCECESKTVHPDLYSVTGRCAIRPGVMIVEIL
jgi:hypothetical protein